MDIREEMLKIQTSNFIDEHNDIIEKLFVLKNNIIEDSKERFIDINKELLENKERTIIKLNDSKLELEDYCSWVNPKLDTAVILLDKVKDYKKKYDEIREIKFFAKGEYRDLLIKFELIFNLYLNRQLSLEDNKLEEFKEYGYFNEELIDELIALFNEYYICTNKGNELNKEIFMLSVERSTDSLNKAR